MWGINIQQGKRDEKERKWIVVKVDFRKWKRKFFIYLFFFILLFQTSCKQTFPLAKLTVLDKYEVGIDLINRPSREFFLTKLVVDSYGPMES